MASKTYVNAVTDAVIAKLNAAVSTLGNFTTIMELDIEPSVIADSQVSLPILVVQPITKGDSMDLTIGTTGEMYHDYTITIIGYYKFNKLSTDIRTMRNYAYDCADLFRGSNAQVGYGHIYSMSINPGYFVMVDNPIYRWSVTLTLTMIES